MSEEKGTNMLFEVSTRFRKTDQQTRGTLHVPVADNLCRLMQDQTTATAVMNVLQHAMYQLFVDEARTAGIENRQPNPEAWSFQALVDTYRFSSIYCPAPSAAQLVEFAESFSVTLRSLGVAESVIKMNLQHNHGKGLETPATAEDFRTMIGRIKKWAEHANLDDSLDAVRVWILSGLERKLAAIEARKGSSF